MSTSSEYLTETHDALKILEKYKINILSANIRSFNKNIDIIENLIKDLKYPPVLTMCELWKPLESVLHIKNYQQPIFNLRNNKNGGGVGIWVKKGFKILKKDYLKQLKLKIIEAVSVEIEAYYKHITIVSIYRPPNSNSKQSRDELNTLFEFFHNKKNLIIYSGDTNYDILKPNQPETKAYVDILENYELKQMVSKPTRITSKTSTGVDHVITNKPYLIKETILDSRVADHQNLLISCLPRPNRECKKQTQNENKSFYKLNLDKSIDKLNTVDWVSLNSNVDKLGADEALKLLIKEINSNLIFESKKIHRKYNPKKPWMTKEILQTKNDTDKLRKKFLKKPTKDTEQEYKSKKLLYDKKIRDAKRSYHHQEILNSKGDPKKIWNIINKLLNRKQKERNDNIKLVDPKTGHVTSEPEQVAEIFNNFYINFAPELAESIPKTSITAEQLIKNTKRPTNFFSFRHITADEVKDIIKTMKPKLSSGPDNIPPIIIKGIKNQIAYPLQKIINKSFDESTFPQCIKTSKLQPIPKTDDLTQATNFRPLNQTPSFSKIAENIALSQVTPFLKTNKVISENQFGFQANHSTLHPLMLTIDYIEKNINKGLYVLLIAIDYRKAFDTVDTKTILPMKLRHYNFDQNAINWYKSLFLNRTQYTTINNTKSKTEKLKDISVIQGSATGPTAFNLYINDLADNSNFESIFFADDTSLLLANKDLKKLESIANKELKNILTYTQANKLSLNLDKTVYTIFKPNLSKRKQNLKLELFLGINPTTKMPYQIREVKEIKFLGITIDNQLKFETHYQKVINKMKSGIAALNFVKFLLPTKTKIQIFNGLIKPHYEYSSIIWSRNLNKKQIQQILTLQKKAIRLVFQAKRLSHTSILFKQTSITRFDYLLTKTSLDLFHRKTLNLLPNAITKLLDLPKYDRLRTSHKDNLKIPDIYKKGDLIYELTKSWNECDHQIKEPSINQNIMKTNIKKYINSKIINCSAINCLPCKYTPTFTQNK